MDRPDGWQIIGVNLSGLHERLGRTHPFFLQNWRHWPIKAFGDMGQTARLRIIRDRFVAEHNTFELHRHLDSVPPETPLRDIVDRCRVWESHANSDVRRASKPGPTQTFPTYMVSDSDRGRDELRVAAVTAQPSPPDQLETMLRLLLVDTAVPALVPKPELLTVEQLLQCLLACSQARQPIPVPTAGNSDLETLLRSLLPGNPVPTPRPRQGPIRRDWTTVVCFSFAKPGHSATRCLTLNES